MTSRRGKDGSRARVAGVITGGVRQATIKRALKAGADLLELRVDTFANRTPRELIRHCERLKAVKGARSIPVIITVRSKAEGGLHRIPDADRLEIFKALIPFADYVDIELSSAAILTDVVRSAKRVKVIVSYHNFTSTPAPAKLRTIIRRGAGRGGRYSQARRHRSAPDGYSDAGGRARRRPEVDSNSHGRARRIEQNILPDARLAHNIRLRNEDYRAGTDAGGGDKEATNFLRFLTPPMGGVSSTRCFAGGALTPPYATLV